MACFVDLDFSNMYPVVPKLGDSIFQKAVCSMLHVNNFPCMLKKNYARLSSLFMRHNFKMFYHE